MSVLARSAEATAHDKRVYVIETREGGADCGVTGFVVGLETDVAFILTYNNWEMRALATVIVALQRWRVRVITTNPKRLTIGNSNYCSIIIVLV